MSASPSVTPSPDSPESVSTPAPVEPSPTSEPSSAVTLEPTPSPTVSPEPTPAPTDAPSDDATLAALAGIGHTLELLLVCGLVVGAVLVVAAGIWIVKAQRS